MWKTSGSAGKRENVFLCVGLRKNVCEGSVLMFCKSLAQIVATPKARGLKKDLCLQRVLS